MKPPLTDTELLLNTNLRDERKNLLSDFSLTASLTSLAWVCLKTDDPEGNARIMVGAWCDRVLSHRDKEVRALSELAFPDDPTRSIPASALPAHANSEDAYRRVVGAVADECLAGLLSAIELVRALTERGKYMSWRLATSLAVLREQINKAYPKRSKKSDGTVGDAAHASRKSDHNPWVKSGGIGVVTAIDITHDPANGVDGHVLSRQLAADPRTKYVIYNFQIYRSYKPKLGWASYSGTNPHVHHVHLSVKPELMDQTTPWAIDSTPILRRGDRGEAVKDLQRKLLIEVDGIFGYGTENAVKKFQQASGLKVDGIVGDEVRERLKQ